MDMNIFELSTIWNDIDSTVEFLQNWNLLKRTHICCGQNVGLVKSRSKDGREFKCNSCKHRYSLRTGSFFFNCHLSLCSILSLMYFFCIGLSLKDTCNMLKRRVSRKSVIQWFVFLETFVQELF